MTGDASYDEMAFHHFNTTADNIIRSNGSTYNTFYFDKETGAPKCGATHQGFSDDSTWSRGQAWGCLLYTSYANKTGAQFSAVIGDDDIAAKSASVKNMQTGETDNVPFDHLAEFIKTNTMTR